MSSIILIYKTKYIILFLITILQNYCFSILLQARCDVNAQDFDGWTPLHGAAHWGQSETCKLLVDNFCDMDIKNYAVSNIFIINVYNIIMVILIFILLGTNCF